MEVDDPPRTPPPRRARTPPGAGGGARRPAALVGIRPCASSSSPRRSSWRHGPGLGGVLPREPANAPAVQRHLHAGQPGPGPNANGCHCLAPSLVPVSPAQIKRIVAFKVRAVWGTYAARHIARYGCGTYELSQGSRPDDELRRPVRSRQQNVVTRRVRLTYVRTQRRPGRRAGQSGAAVPDAVRPPRRRTPPPGQDPTVSTGPAIPSDG